jgi:outer membrane protein assembly factor BamB
MSRTALAALGLSILLGGVAELRAQVSRTAIIPSQMARRQGLERAWVTQVEIDRSRGRIAHVTLHDGLLLVQTDQAALHVLDAETRRTMWIAHIGRPGAVSSPPAVSDKFIASTNGGDLYLFERDTGRALWRKHLSSVASAGPVLGSGRVYIPMVNGIVASYRLPRPRVDGEPTEEETPLEKLYKDTALNYQGKGMADAAPIVTHASVVWGTAAGNVYACTPDQLLAMYRVKTHGPISAPLTYRAPHVFAASRDGYLYCIKDPSGDIHWQFSVGTPIAEKPVIIGDALFVISETGGLYRINANTGAQEWFVPGVYQFVSGSPTRLYTVDSSGRMLILDARNGSRLGTLATEQLPLKVLNTETDRIYLGTRTGMIQCLREIELVEPFVHGAVGAPLDAVEEPAEGEGDKPADEKPKAPAADPNDPFGEGEPAMKDDAAMEGEEAPADGEEMAEEEKAN